MSELTADAKKLTVFNPDGSIKVAGFVPWFGYGQNTSVNFGHAFGGSWYNDDGTSALATDPAWAAMLRWQKDLVDFYGADNLARFVAGAGDEFSAANDLQTGRVAMTMDGEWRVAFIADGAPSLSYGTAPFPVADDRPDLYGSGQIGGDLLGIPRGSAHPAEAWLLLKYMATDTASLVYMANAIRNVPTTLVSLKSPDLSAPSQFRTFLEVAASPNSLFKQPSLIGAADQQLFQTFLEKWQAGKVSDLNAGLQQVASQIDDQLSQGT
jgi:multiple sugar transport system substrate-binding protein